MQLICAFVLAYAKSRFSYDEVQNNQSWQVTLCNDILSYNVKLINGGQIICYCKFTENASLKSYDIKKNLAIVLSSDGNWLDLS